MPRELTQGEITTRELDRLISEIKDDKLKSQIRETISRLELHKSYGLRFERHLPEVITHEGKTIDLGEQYFPWLRKVEQVKGKNPKGPEHLLLECDNYIALKYLQYTHQGKVDVIYIDPPYNTGNKDFRYNDKFVDSEDNFRHSKWLSFMEKRLKLAKSLLSDKGVIFISIDDREQAGLRLLCDDIFGEGNLIANIIWRKKRGGGRGNSIVIPQTEYILAYALKINKLNPFEKELSEHKISKYKFQDGFGKYAREGLDHHSPHGAYERKTLQYKLIINDKPIFCPTGQWLWSEKRIKEELDNYKISEAGEKEYKYIDLALDTKNRWRAFKKMRLNDAGENRKETVLSIIDDPTMTTNTSASEIKDLFGVPIFSYSKPLHLIKHLVSVSSSPNSLILDFFAGSGTTYQAVAELNEEDGGNRQCILVTNNESNICREVTWERVKRVTTGTHDYPECTKKYDGNPSAHATFYTMEIYTDDEIDQQTRGWKKNMEGYLPLVSTKFNIAHNWKKIPDTRGYYCEGTAILSTDELDYEAQSFLKKEAIERLIIISEDKEEFELARKRCKKTTKVSEFHFLPRNYREYFANFHTKA